MGVVDTRVITIAKQTVWGTPVTTSTAKLMHIDSAKFEPQVDGELVSGQRGTLAPAVTSIINKITGKLTLQGTLTYEDAPYLFDSLFPIATPGAGPGYARAYTGVTKRQAAPSLTRLSTIFIIDEDGAYYLQDSLLSKLSLEGKAFEKVKYTAEFIGTAVASGTDVGTPADRALTIVHTGDLTIKRGAAGATFSGLSALGICSQSFKMDFDPSRQFIPCMGARTPSAYYERAWKVGMSASFTFANALASAGFTPTNPTSLPTHNMRYSFNGGTNKTMDIDLALAQLKAPALWNDADGMTTVAIDAAARYDTGTATWVAINVANAVSTMA